ncbi:MAG TPA: MBL fold metallo-hydrolase [Steroidobacteraceae bacterium]|nr:MBL fold metallo-hydrolase [Steroidobacteraceae bacterium]
MRSIYTARLVNGVWGDPGLCVDLPFQRRALLFDIGDVAALPTRMLLRVSDVFVSHTHMDHFAGFDHLLRVCLGRDTGVRMYGPEGFIDRVEHKLAAYTWNLVQNYATDFVVEARELQSDGRVARAQFRSRARFQREPLPVERATDGVLLEDPQFRVRARALEHHDIVSLAFSFEEGTHINVWKSRLEARRLPSGPWLTELKRQVRAGAPDDTPIHIRWRTREGAREEVLPLGELKRDILEFVPGKKLCYVTDIGGHERNLERVVDFVRDADLLFIEAVFLEADAELAARKAHLTTMQAGEIARRAQVKRAEPFHFSSRYRGSEAAHREEFLRAWTST